MPNVNKATLSQTPDDSETLTDLISALDKLGESIRDYFNFLKIHNPQIEPLAELLHQQKQSSGIEIPEKKLEVLSDDQAAMAVTYGKILSTSKRFSRLHSTLQLKMNGTDNGEFEALAKEFGFTQGRSGGYVKDRIGEILRPLKVAYGSIMQEFDIDYYKEVEALAKDLPSNLLRNIGNSSVDKAAEFLPATANISNSLKELMHSIRSHFPEKTAAKIEEEWEVSTKVQDEFTPLQGILYNFHQSLKRPSFSYSDLESALDPKFAEIRLTQIRQFAKDAKKAFAKDSSENKFNSGASIIPRISTTFLNGGTRGLLSKGTKEINDYLELNPEDRDKLASVLEAAGHTQKAVQDFPSQSFSSWVMGLELNASGRKM